MGDLPAWMLRHQVVIEPLVGTGPYGEVFGAPVTVACVVDTSRRLVRDEHGDQVISDTRVFAPAGTVAPAGSRVTVPDGRRATVLATHVRDGGGLPTPDHVEIVLT